MFVSWIHSVMLGQLAITSMILTSVVSSLEFSSQPGFLRNCTDERAVVSAAWRNGSVFFDSVSVQTPTSRRIAAAWCSQLRDGDWGPFAAFSSWSPDVMRDSLGTDLGVEWARSSASVANHSRVWFTVSRDSLVGFSEYFTVATTFDVPDSVDGPRLISRHRTQAVVSGDRVRFVPALAAALRTASRWRSGPIQFIRLDGGAIDTLRALDAVRFVQQIRTRLGLADSLQPFVRYLYSTQGNGAALLGFERFPDEIDGFSGRRPVHLVFSNVREAAEYYRHELVHAALFAFNPALPFGLEEPLAKALGGTRERTWTAFLCEERSWLLDREGVRSFPELFAKPDSQVSGTLREWETALLIGWLVSAKGDAALREWMASHPDVSTRTSTRVSVARAAGITSDVLVQEIARQYGEAALRSNCTDHR